MRIDLQVLTHETKNFSQQKQWQAACEDEPFTNLYVKCFPSHFKEHLGRSWSFGKMSDVKNKSW